VYRNILVAIDGSTASDGALVHAAGLAQALDARLTVLTVVAPLPAYAYQAGIDVGALEAEAERAAEGRLQTAAASGALDRTDVTTRVRHGHPGEEIVAAADEDGHDLVVLGSRRRGRLAAGLLGSVGVTLNHHLRVPLLIVHSTAASAPES
jgi:universal stress protein A